MLPRNMSLMPFLLVMALDGSAASAQGASSRSHAVDSASAVAVVERYRDALRRGDTASAVSMLDSNAVILESGGIETRQQYIAHHLPADIAFAKSVASSSKLQSVKVSGDMAWVASTNRSAGMFKGRSIDSDGAELMVLSRGLQGWKISAIHWSSRKNSTK
jgi:ketosteroid isomerase-like protein